MKKQQIKRLIISSVACVAGIGVILGQGVMIHNRNQVIDAMSVQVSEVQAELQKTDDKIKLKNEENRKLEKHITELKEGNEKNNQRIYTLEEDIKKLEEKLKKTSVSSAPQKTAQKKEEVVVTRERKIASPRLYFDEHSDVTKIRISDGDVLNRGLKGKLKGLGWAFVRAGVNNGIDPLFLASIAAQESGWGKYDHGNNNITGIMSGATSFSSYEECLNYTARLLAKHYVGEGRNTPAKIQPKYCPNPNDWHFKIAGVAKTIIQDI